MLRPSRIVAESLKLEPLALDVSEEDTTCCMCGFPIKAGDGVCFEPLKGLANFMDEALMASKTNVACQWCSRFVKKGYSKKPLFIAANKVHTTNGSFEINTDACRTWFFLTPPAPPYVAVLNEGMNAQHHAWCGPVTLDNEQITVKFGKQFLVIRHSRLLVAIDKCKEAAELMNSESKKKKDFTHPYKFLDRKITSLDHGSFHYLAKEIAKSNQRMAEILLFLQKNTIGETWALSSLVKKKIETPVQNGPITA